MAEKALPQKDKPRQGAMDLVFDIRMATKGGTEKYNRALFWGDNGPRRLLRQYCCKVKELYNKRRKLKDPMNKRTGKFLKPSTLAAYRSSLPSCEQSVQDYKIAIRLLIIDGYFGNKARAGWIRRIRIRIDFNYTKGLKGKEKKFVEKYNGNAIWAARYAGYSGNFFSMKKIGRKNMSKPRIISAIMLKKQSRIPGLMVLDGRGQGDGVPFNVGWRGDSSGGFVYLTQYMSAIRKRFDQRIENIKRIHDESEDKYGDQKASRAWDLHHELHSYVWGGDKNDYYNSRECKDIDHVSEMIAKAEKELGLAPRGNYKGW